MATMAISVTPVGTGSTSISEYVAAAHKVIRDSGLKCELNAMTTNVEGDLDKLMSLVTEIHRTLQRRGCARLSTTIKIDDRIDRHQTLEDKVKSVEERIR